MSEDLLYESGYIEGLVEMMSTCFGSPSMITAICFDKNNYLRELSELCGYAPEKLKIEKAEITLEEFMLENLNGTKESVSAVQTLKHLMGFKTGKLLSLHTVDAIAEKGEESFIDKAGYANGWARFYIVFDMILAKFENFTVLFIAGCDE